LNPTSQILKDRCILVDFWVNISFESRASVEISPSLQTRQ
jgi:hypothetical protein